MAQFYVPRYDTGSGNPWAGAASAYGNELDRLGSLQQQGMQDTSQLPMKLYQSFLQGYQDQQAQAQAEADFQMKQGQIDRMNRMADLQQQKADEAEAFRRDQLKQLGALQSAKLLGEAQKEIAQDYQSPLRGAYKTQIKTALMAKGMGDTEADAAAEAYLPKLAQSKYEATVAPDESAAPDAWTFKIPGASEASIVTPGEEQDQPTSWSFSPGDVNSDTYVGSRIVEAQRKEARDAQLAAQVAAQQAETERKNKASEDLRQQQILAMIAKTSASQQDPMQRLLSGSATQGMPTGKALFDSLPPGLQNNMRQILTGQMQLNPRGKENLALIQLAGAIDPNFDMVKAGARKKMMDSTASGGVLDRTNKSFNMIVGHLNDYLDKINEMPDTPVGPLNSLIIQGKMATDPNFRERMGALSANINVAASEMPTYFRGTSQTAERDIQEANNLLGMVNSGKSRSERRGAAQQLLKLMLSRALPTQETYTSTMGPVGGQWSIANENTKNILRNRLGEDALKDIEPYWQTNQRPSWGLNPEIVPGQGPSSSAGRIKVRAPNGSIGTIPSAQLEDAKRQGYTEVP